MIILQTLLEPPVIFTNLQRNFEKIWTPLTPRTAVPNLFINRANIGDKKSWRAFFALENKNMSKIALFKDIKGEFSIQITFYKDPVGILKYLGGQQNVLGH